MKDDPPKFVVTGPKVAAGPPMRMSHASARSMPAPKAGPCRRGNRWLSQTEQGKDDRLVSVELRRLRGAYAVDRAEAVEVVSGAKGFTLAGQEQASHAWLMTCPPHQSRKIGDHRPVERVALGRFSTTRSRPPSSRPATCSEHSGTTLGTLGPLSSRQPF